MSEIRQQRHIVYINIVLFFVNALLGFVGAFLPQFGIAQNTAWKLGEACFIAACTITGFKMAREHWDIPAAGFAMLAIAYGVFFAGQNFINASNGITMVADGVLLYLPAMFLITYYTRFPFWVRILGLIACIPFAIILILTFVTDLNAKRDMALFGTSFALIQITGLVWGIYFLKFNREK
jgi:hypothetical protein